MLEVDIDEKNDITIEVNVTEGQTGDYTKLRNLPTLDGNTIIGDMKERDPTIPEWAKQDTKPSYSANEVGSVDVDNFISLEEISQLFEESEEQIYG